MAAAAVLAWPAARGEAAEMIGFRRLAIPDDVPAHLTTALVQDRDGFLWIGTQGGLVRWDGYRFRVFRQDPDDASTLGGSYVRALHAGHDGRLWVGTFSGGLSVFDPASARFRRYRHDPANPSSLSHDRVEGIAEDDAGRIWLATDGGLDRLESDGGFTHFRHDAGDPSSLADDRVRAVAVDRRDQVWVGSRDGVQRWRGEGGGFAAAGPGRGEPGSLAGQLVNKIFEDSRGRLWLATAENGAALVDAGTGVLIRRLEPRPAAPEGLSHFWVYGIAEAGSEVWIATFGGGVDVVDADSLDVVARLRSDAAREDTIGGDRVGAVLRDDSGVVWVGTWGQGIARHDPATRAFRAWRHSPSDAGGLSHPAAVRAQGMRDGSIWVGTNGNGVDILDRRGKLVGGHRPRPSDSGALADGAVTCLAQSADGTRWVATLDGTLHRLPPGASRFERITSAHGLPRGPVRAMTFDRRGDLWLGAAEGMARIAAATGRINAFRHRPDDPRSLSGNAVEAIALAPDGRLWVGTTNGLNRFDPESGAAEAILRDPSRRDSLPDNWIPDLLVTRGGQLWIATQAGAYTLESRSLEGARFAPVFARFGLPAAPVESLIEDSDGRVWLGPRWRVDPQAGRIEEFGAADGRAFRNFFIASRARLADGELLFGSPEGLLGVRPDRIAPWSYEPRLVASGLWLGSSEVPGAARLAELLIPAGTSGFRLAFAALDFTAPERLRYRYRLLGADDRWTTTDAGQPALGYAGLAPGRYTLEVDGSNRAGRWSSHRLRLPVAVLPAFYQTGWFRAMSLAALAAVAWSAYRWRVARLEARGRELEGLVAARTSELAATNAQLAAAYLEIEQASLTDPLTGLRNRRYLEQTIPADLELAARRHQDDAAADDASLVLLLVDLDHFKSVNDTHGHHAGDAVLVQLGSILRRLFRSADHVVRWGGEEFLVVARFVDRAETASFAEKLRAAVAAHEFALPEGGSIRRSCSIGAAAYPFVSSAPRQTDWDGMVAICDLALYAAKRSGRDAWVAVSANHLQAEASFRAAPAVAAAAGAVRIESSLAQLLWEDGASPPRTGAPSASADRAGESR